MKRLRRIGSVDPVRSNWYAVSPVVRGASGCCAGLTLRTDRDWALRTNRGLYLGVRIVRVRKEKV